MIHRKVILQPSMHWVQWGIPLVALKANVIKGHPMNEYCVQGEKGVK